MPKSSKPRKKGAHGHFMDAMRAARRDNYKGYGEMKRVYNTLLRQRRRVRTGTSLFAWMNDLCDPDTLFAAFGQAFFALNRWRETTDIEDFNSVSRLLMIGAVCHKEMGVTDNGFMRDIRNAAFQTIICVRLRNFEQDLPDGNIEAVRAGLTAAEELVKYANENDRNTLLDVIRQNLPEYVSAREGLREQRERFILGEHYEQVQRWIKEDPKGFLHHVDDDEKDLR